MNLNAYKGLRWTLWTTWYVTNNPVPNYIKIDGDGVKNLVVSGMSGLLDDDRLYTIMIEIESVISKGQIEKRIESADFCEVMKEQWHDKSIYNVLYVRQSKLTSIQDH